MRLNQCSTTGQEVHACWPIYYLGNEEHDDGPRGPKKLTKEAHGGRQIIADAQHRGQHTRGEPVYSLDYQNESHPVGSRITDEWLMAKWQTYVSFSHCSLLSSISYEWSMARCHFIYSIYKRPTYRCHKWNCRKQISDQSTLMEQISEQQRRFNSSMTKITGLRPAVLEGECSLQTVCNDLCLLM